MCVGTNLCSDVCDGGHRKLYENRLQVCKKVCACTYSTLQQTAELVDDCETFKAAAALVEMCAIGCSRLVAYADFAILTSTRPGLGVQGLGRLVH